MTKRTGPLGLCFLLDFGFMETAFLVGSPALVPLIASTAVKGAGEKRFDPFGRMGREGATGRAPQVALRGRFVQRLLQSGGGRANLESTDPDRLRPNKAHSPAKGGQRVHSGQERVPDALAEPVLRITSIVRGRYPACPSSTSSSMISPG